MRIRGASIAVVVAVVLGGAILSTVAGPQVPDQSPTVPSVTGQTPSEAPDLPIDTAGEDDQTPSPIVPEGLEATTAEQEPAVSAILTVQREIDGDSFVASDGIEYRVGMINTPESNECGGSAASRAAYELLADGFTVQGYATDNYGRTVARITLTDGRDLGETLAANGWADDRYLAQFRHENQAYAADLDRAFAQAGPDLGVAALCDVTQRPGESGLPPAAQPTAVPVQQIQPLVGGGEPQPAGGSGCHPAYIECIPVTSDLDCGDIGHQVHLSGNADPYQLDGRSFTRQNGLGCESYPPA